MKDKLRFCVMGGDLRQIKLAELLAEDGHSVCTYAMEQAVENSQVQNVCTHDRVAGADCVVMPLPVITSDGKLNAPFSDAAYDIGKVLDLLNEKQIICAGLVPAWLHKQAREQGLMIHDYFAREELAVANAVPTAEGVVQIALEEMPITVHGARVLVIGFGRTGKLVAHRFACLGARVSVAARKFSDLAWIEAFGYAPEQIGQIDGWLFSYDLVVNTVPARMLTEQRLRELRPDCLSIDIASNPGGIDFEAAASLGVKAIWALSLPGRVAPVTSGKIIRNTIYNILHELGA